MAGDDSGEPIEPGNGRIIGAGGNNLQRSLDALNFSLQRLLLANSGGLGAGRRMGPVMAPGDQSEGDRPSSAPQAGGPASFPAAVSWNSNNSGVQWSPAAVPPATPGRPPVPSGGGGGGGGGGGSQRARQTTSAAKNLIGSAQSLGLGLLKQGLPMDNYAQWAAIQAGSPLGPDGTNGRAVNSIRKYVFGSQGSNQIMWAQNIQDASNAAFIASRNSGFSALAPGSNSQINPAFSGYMGNIKDLALTNPMMTAAQSANVMGTLSSTRGLYSAMMFGYKPVLGPGGAVDRNSLGGFADSVMHSAYGKNSVSARNLAAGLGQNGILNGNIQAYVNAAGGDQKTTQALEDYITGRNTAVQSGLTGSQFDKLLNQFEAGGKSGEAAGNRLKKIGITNSILQSQKDLSGAKAQTTSDLLDSFGPAIKKANEALGDMYGVIDRIVNMPGIKQLLGYAGGFGAVFGGLAGGLTGGLGGIAAGRFLTGALPLAATAGRAGIPFVPGALGATAGATASLSTLALGGAAVFLAAGAGGQHWKQADTEFKAFQQWEKEQNNVPDVGKLKGKQFTADYSRFSKIWDQAQKDKSAARTTGTDGVGGGSSGSVGGSGSSGSGVPGGGSVITGKSAAGAIRSALAELGKKYQWGATGPDSWDCSGLMQHAYGSVGVRLPRTSEQQMGVGQAVDRKGVLPGDLMFPNSGHVVMYIGGGKIVEAPRTGENVRVASVGEYGQYAAIRRIVGSVGNLAGIDTSGGSAVQKSQSAASGSGNSGSPVIGSGGYGSVEEVDAINASLSSAAGGGAPAAPQSASASRANTVAPSSSGPWQKNSGSVTRAKSLGKQLASQMYGWTGGQWDAIDKLLTGESGWRWWAENPTSGAYGLGQALPGSKMASVGKDWKTNPATQLKWDFKYIHDRYGDPKNAYATWSQRSPHWYDSGAWNIPQDQTAVVHKGEMIIEKPKADTIRNALMSDVVNVHSPGNSKGGGNGLTLVFDKNSVNFNVSGAMTEAQAQSAGTVFAQTLANDHRLNKLARGL